MKWIIHVALTIGSVASFGQVPAELKTCAGVADEKARLKCYDEYVARESKAFGLTRREAVPAALPPEPEERTATVKSVSTRAHGEFRIEMVDGQVWIETLRTGGAAPEPGETVVLKPGAMGSFYLTRKVGTALRVKRIK